MSFLRQLFGPTKEDVWREFADRVGGFYVDGGFWKGDYLAINHGEWTITFDTYTVTNNSKATNHTSNIKQRTTYTRLRAPFVSNGFTFKIYPEGLFSEVGKFFGMQDIQIGDAFFDDAFIIKSNDEEMVRQLFRNPKIKELAHSSGNFAFSIKDDDEKLFSSFPDGVDVLHYYCEGEVKDLNQLHRYYLLFAETLNTLCHLGAAYNDDPGIVLD